MRRKVFIGGLLALGLAVSACTSTTPGAGPSSGSDASETPNEEFDDAEETGELRAGAEEAEEEAEQTSERVEAFEQAKAAGDFASRSFLTGPAPAGWYDVRTLDARSDDWEPAVAADPREPFVYVMTTRYGVEKGCTTHCQLPYLPLTISKDGGATWEPSVPICSCRDSHGQYDPTIEVVPETGDVYTAYLTADRKGAFSTVFQRSTNHGQSWSAPVRVYGRVGWTDKPEITMSSDGKHVYVAWNGPQGGDPYVGVSHDYGKTWTQTKLLTSKSYYYAYDGTVLPNGTVVFSQSALVYGGVGQEFDRSVQHVVFISRDKGKTWKRVLVDEVERGESCTAEGCYEDYYLGQASVANDRKGDLYFAYEGAVTDGAPQQVYVRVSTDAGRTWGARTALSVEGENATGPRIDTAGSGDVRIWYDQTANGDHDAWNVWYRSSSDGGKTWSRPLRLSTASQGAGYLSADGFAEVYGDYGEIAVTSEGNTVAVWGAGFDYIGPGNTWVAVQK